MQSSQHHYPVMFVLDTSEHISQLCLERLHYAMLDFIRYVDENDLPSIKLEIAVLTIGGGAQLIRDFVTYDDMRLPVLESWGKRHLGMGLQLALNTLQKRHMVGRNNSVPCYPPCMVIVSDFPADDPICLNDTLPLMQRADEAGTLKTIFVLEPSFSSTCEEHICGQPPKTSKGQLEHLNFDDFFHKVGAQLYHPTFQQSPNASSSYKLGL